jgi:hypothetical protein
VKKIVYPEISLNELPRYHQWPERLLASTPEPVRLKTVQEVQREFNRDKWGALLSYAVGDPGFDIHAAECMEMDPETVIPFYDDGKLFLAPFRHVRERHIELYSEVLSKYADHASALVELGAGFGSKIIGLSSKNIFRHLPLYAAELTSSGRELIDLLATRAGKHINVGACDFREGSISLKNIPPGAIVFTSFAAHYVPELNSMFVKFISDLKPLVVVHFEPCMECMSTYTLHELMCINYIKRNDYNQNLVSLLNSESVDGELRNLSIRPNVMGDNPLLPLSVITWEP